MKPLLSPDKLDFAQDGAIVARMTIYPSSPLYRISEAEATEYGEEPLQLLENGYYEYELDNPSHSVLAETGNGILKPSVNPSRRHCGTIEPGLNTGRLGLVALDCNGKTAGMAAVEVRSKKVEYRTHYRMMMEDITEQCISLLMELRSPSGLRFAPDPGRTSETIHQRFAFLRSSDEDLSRFIHDVVEHVCDRATARERQTYHIYRANEEPSEYQVRQAIPECEPASKQRHAPPAETFVLIGWCRGEEHRKWIVREKLYNCRMDYTAGSLRLNPEVAGARYLLLHGDGAKATPGLFRISSKGIPGQFI